MAKILGNYDTYDVFLFGNYVATAHVEIDGGAFAAKKRACKLKKSLTPHFEELEVKFTGRF
ncbi:MAG: hypothetical protein KBT34_03180 [Prevotella sp.]|nr:hypothetical protein [Candidatus Prevotella equi]